MRALTGTLYINKIAAASRQLDAAIRMFFAKEDDLAVHTVASAAFRILRDVTKKRGKNIATEVIRAGIYGMARQYAEGKMPKEMLKGIENTALMDTIKRIVEDERAQGDKFDLNRILITNERANEQRAWPSKAANFLKHADRDHEEHLAVDALENGIRSARRLHCVPGAYEDADAGDRGVLRVLGREERYGYGRLGRSGTVVEAGNLSMSPLAMASVGNTFVTQEKRRRFIGTLVHTIWSAIEKQAKLLISAHPYKVFFYTVECRTEPDAVMWQSVRVCEKI